MSATTLVYPARFPAIVLPRFSRDWGFVAAMLVSVIIHGVALGWLPGLSDPLNALPRPIQIRLSPPIVAPEPVADLPAPTPAPLVRAIRRDADVAAQPVLPVLSSPAHESAQAPSAVRNVEPPVAAPIEASRPNPPASAARSSVPDTGMLAAYGRELAGAVATHQRYPRLALLRQWQGTALLQLELGADGRLLAVRVLSSSGHETLDRQALDMVRDAVPLPQLPAALAGRPLTVDVPVVFRITS